MFSTRELSRFLGRPVHLFVFTRQSLAWRFCGADRDLTVGGQTYLGAQIERSEIKQTVERAKDKITITLAYLRDPAAAELPVTQSLGDLWHPYAPSDPVYVTCLAAHAGDDGDPAVEWIGQVTQPAYTDVELTLTCEPVSDIQRARNQGAKWQRGCWKTVYSTGLRGCNLDPAPYTVAAELAAVDGLTLTAVAFAGAAQNLAGGTLSWTRADGIVERRSIMAHEGETIVVLYGAADLAAGLAVSAVAGCPQTWAACAARGNTVNFGGAIYKPVENPMDGRSMSWG